ncbi:3-deoxy-7-phosphoheptulonate synthase class II [Cellulomonas sp. zg-ZUI199]|uniref:Phospho-2-dehydro-3-deoxyheptonate aldolase n=1 Tax=Cellulomonas wangleii TaxID=2816956 RepID=A0ABX8D4P2_9CELL|nr:3-deoxy-7-phosphoheptulonate synthase class II [Cellulomonas wangleii]MBO0924424.1 3-deoxy-7-phosphoheptulonate synthase class II [Cellulomonas wangleii]QVI62420.1 3-deoxy-7-phosphoheptulonate synthase class II [Cellulomonas wangleii]
MTNTAEVTDTNTDAGAPWTSDAWRTRPVAQAVDWPDEAQAQRALEQLRKLPPLIFAGEARALQSQLADVTRGAAFVLLAGDCAESFDEVSADRIRDQLKIILQMSLVLTHGAGLPVVKIGRMAGQLAKPRSAPTEIVNGVELQSLRGHLLNAENEDPDSRRLDPRRLVQGYHHSAIVLNLVRAFTSGGFADLREVHRWNQSFIAESPSGQRYEMLAAEIDRAVEFLHACGVRDDNDELSRTAFYTAHEALVLDYESGLTRREAATGEWYDCSAHLLWIGERTRALDGAHMDFVRGIRNPIGVKISDDCSPEELLQICTMLNPERIPGRLTLMIRMGARVIDRALPALVQAVVDAGHPVAWVSDPMHGNTRTTASGVKTRSFEDVSSEFLSFVRIVSEAGAWPGGIHLELTPDDVTECTGGSWLLDEDELGRNYTSLCDPRLNGRQGLDLAFLAAEALRDARTRLAR